MRLPGQTTTRRGVVSRLGILGVISVVAGLLLGGMLLPIVGGVGLLARTGANDFERLPSSLDISAPPQVSRILAADGSPNAEASRTKDDVMLPGIGTCVECHAPLSHERGGARFDCAECHRYHNGDRPLDGLRCHQMRAVLSSRPKSQET